MKIITNPPLRRWERLAITSALRQEKTGEDGKKSCPKSEKKAIKPC